MDLKELAAFLGIFDHGSLTRAAVTLGLAQSVLSRRIASLEMELGGRLFHRTGRGVVPTELAELLAARARNVLVESDALLEEARGARESPAGVVDMALVPAVARSLVGLLCARLRREFPRIRLRVHEAYSGQVEALLASGRTDIGVFNRYTRAAVKDAELMVSSDIVLAVRRDRATFKGAEVPFRTVDRQPLVLPPQPNALVSVIRDLAQKQRIDLDIALEAGSATLLRDAVTDAGFATLIPAHLAQRDYAGPDFVFARVIKPVIIQRTWMALTTQRPTTLAARTVARLARDSVRSLNK